MKKLFMVSMVTLVSLVSMGQERFVSHVAHINTINNQYIESRTTLYITIENDKVLFTNKKGDKVFDEFKIGETKKGDNIIKYTKNSISEGTTGKEELVRKTMDTFTNKSSKIVYELIPFTSN